MAVRTFLRPILAAGLLLAPPAFAAEPDASAPPAASAWGVSVTPPSDIPASLACEIHQGQQVYFKQICIGHVIQLSQSGAYLFTVDFSNLAPANLAALTNPTGRYGQPAPEDFWILTWGASGACSQVSYKASVSSVAAATEQVVFTTTVTPPTRGPCST